MLLRMHRRRCSIEAGSCRPHAMLCASACRVVLACIELHVARGRFADMQEERPQEKEPFADCFTDAGILADFEGSDHAPVYADLALQEPLPRAARAPPIDLRNRRTGTGAPMLPLTAGPQALSVCCA